MKNEKLAGNALNVSIHELRIIFCWFVLLQKLVQSFIDLLQMKDIFHDKNGFWRIKNSDKYNRYLEQWTY